MESANPPEAVERKIESPRHDAILLYSLQDLEPARQLYGMLKAEGFSVWFAEEDWQAGALLSREINAALRRSSVVLLCLGSTGTGNYQSWEISAAITGATQGLFQLVPIYLPGLSTEVFNVWPMVRELRAIDLRNGLENRLEIGKLVAALAASRSRVPESGLDSPSAESGIKTAPIIRLASADSEITGLAQTAIQHGVTFFVGPTVPDRHDLAVLNPEAIAADLLCDLGLMDPARMKGGLVDQIMTAPHAAFLFTLKKGGIAAKEISKRLALRSVGEPATYVRLAETLNRLVQLPIFAERSPANPQPLGDVNPNEKRKVAVVTTNVDVSLERSLLKVGLPFSRVVLHRHDSRLLACTFSAVERHPDGRLTITADGKQATTRLLDDVVPKEQVWLKENYLQLSTTELPFERFFKSYEVNRAIREVWSQARVITGAEVLSLREPLLIKVHGSYDVAESSVICADHYFERSLRWSDLVSSFGAVFGHAAAVMIGYTLTEPEFIHLYETWLRHPFELSSSSTRVAMLDPSVRPMDGQDRIYQLLLEEMQREAPRRFKVTPIRASVSEALDKLTAAITDASQSPWLM